MPKKLLGLAVAVLLLCICPLTVGALGITTVPYTTYDYNFYKESISAPAGYVPVEEISGLSLGLEDNFLTPTDLFYDGADSIYLLDSGNGRVIVLNKEFKLKAVYNDFVDQDGMPIDIMGAEGITVGGDGKIYIADTVMERVLVFAADRTYLKEITRPESARLDEENLPFDVSKIMVDNRNNLYVLAKSGNMGAYVFNAEGKYLRFFGGNQVVKTGEVLMKYMLRPFLTQAQLEGLTSSTPINVSNFDVDKEGFVYTTTSTVDSTEVKAGVVRKLNYLGKNILDDEVIYGDLEWDRLGKGQTSVTNYHDVDVDDEGFMNLLDLGKGKVFQYNERGELIAVFGCYGDQLGEFAAPVALESVGGKVCVLDTERGSLTVFRPTAYGEKYRSAIQALKNDDFTSSIAVWESLLKENSNNANAYYGLGRVYDLKADYKQAMEYFKLAGDRESYSESFQEYRNDMVRKLFIPIVIAVLVLYIGLRVLSYVRKKKREKVGVLGASAYSKLESKYYFPFYTLFHPMDGYQQLKPRKIGSWAVSAVILAVLFVTFTLEYFVTGYIFNLNRATDYSLLIMILKTVGIAMLFVLANWAVCTLFNGNGNFKDITCVTTYSLVPLIGGMLINVVLSNFLAASEGAMMNIVLYIAIAWTALLIICGLSSIHEYTMGQTLLCIIATVIGMAVIVFLAMLFFSLMQQTVSFIESIIIEAINR